MNRIYVGEKMARSSGRGHPVYMPIGLYADLIKKAERRKMDVGKYAERVALAGMAVDDKHWARERFQADTYAAERDNNVPMPSPRDYGLPSDFHLPADTPPAPATLKPFRPR